MDETAFIQSLYEESERAGVVLAIAKIDAELEALLKSVLLPCAGGEDSLFDSDRALGTFSAKIAIAHRLGLIDGEFEHALQLMRKIRNEFAHHVDNASLSRGGHRDRVAHLARWTKKNPHFDNARDMAKKAYPDLDDHHVNFMLCVLAILAALETGREKAKRIDLGAAIRIEGA
ncbi:hypothetical protein [Burkholderia ubonensis]|uniref:hypothetical protein n=1 Tax=Burkholderia ubonensis TaxID=101571 RepID=UPI000AE4260E|nr:hypothetical protein [Burkholderia ubonensis]